MNKILKLSLVAATMLAGNAFAMDLAGGKLTGDARVAYEAYAYDIATDDDKNALGLGLNPTYSIEAAKGLSFELGAGIAVPLSESKKSKAAYLSLAKYNDDHTESESYATVTRANAAYDFGQGFVKAGYQELDTPFVGADDIRLVPNSFMAVVATYNGIKYLTLEVAQITEMAGKVDGGADHPEEYNAMSTQVAGSTNSDAGVTALAAIYNNEDAGANGQFWYYTMPETDSVNALAAMYIDAGTKVGIVDIAAQYITHSVEDGDASTSMGLKAEVAAAENIGFTVAYNSYNADNGTAPLYYAWGGYPEYAVADEMWAGSADWDGGTSSKVGVNYSGPGHVEVSAAYVQFSDVATVIDLTAGFEPFAHAHLGVVYEIIDDEHDDDHDKAITKLHASYSF